MNSLDDRVRAAVKHFWTTRATQSKKQGQASGVRDAGERAAATGGAQLDGFVRVICSLLREGGIPDPAVFSGRSKIELPGWFRPEKKWDLLLVADGKLIATLELKSHIGPSFGNNYNNRAEEAVGNAHDIKAAYREGAFQTSIRPWVGYLMLLEEHSASTRPVRNAEPHFPVFEEFRRASYVKRYEVTLTKLVREQLYDAACLITSRADAGLARGDYAEPSTELSFQNFAESLLARAIAHARTERRG